MKVGNGVFLGTGLVLLLAYVSFYILSLGSSGWSTLPVHVTEMGGAALAAAFLLLAYRQFRMAHWLYFGLGACSYMVFHIALVVSTSCLLQVACWVFQYVFYYIALYQLAMAGRYKKRLLQLCLEVILFWCVTATLFLKYLIEPAMKEYVLGQKEGWADLVASSANSSVFLSLLLLLLYNRLHIDSRAASLMTIGFFTKVLGNVLEEVLIIYPNHSVYWNGLPDLCWFLGILLIGASAIFPAVSKEGEAPLRVTKQDVAKRYVPLIVICVTMIVFLASTQPPSLTLVGMMSVLVVLILRLLLGVYEYEAADQAREIAIQNYTRMLENSLVGIFIEQNGRLVFVNAYLESLFGYEPGEMTGEPWMNNVSLQGQQRMMEQPIVLDQSGLTPLICLECRRKDQTIIYVELQALTTTYDGNPAIYGTVVDVTERKSSEQLMLRSEKLSVAGQLAAGVAHEIRNPLTALKGFTQLLYQQSSENRHYYDIMLAELERINYIIGEFMVLSKPHQGQPRQVQQIQDLLDCLIPIMDSQAILHNIVIEVQADENLPLVRCDGNQIKQVFINLLKNAMEAMPDGGVISIRFERLGSSSDLRLGIRIVDTGPGIPEELLQRLGEPFLTTKDTGTGLGLMICYRIIEAHAGTMVIDSIPGHGTSIQIELPGEG